MRPVFSRMRVETMPAVASHQLAPDGRDGRQSEAGTDPQVLLAMTHPTMRALTSELLQRDGRCQVRAVSGRDQAVADAIDLEHPDLVVLDTPRFPGGCRRALRRFPSDRMIVVGPEAGESYRAAALAAGAGAWVARERIGDDLVAEVRRLLAGSKLPPPGSGDDGSSGGASVLDRKSRPHLPRMATAPAPATLAVDATGSEGT